MPPCGPSAAAGARRATRPSNRAACSGRWVSVSACHCTPTKKSRPGSSTPSISRRRAHATGRRPSPSRSMAWWWKELTCASVRAHQRRPAGCRPRSSTAWVTSVPGSVWRWSVGRCWCRVPPRATFSVCAPRQMASTGRPQRVGVAGQLELEAVDLGVDRARRRGAARRRRGRDRGRGRRTGRRAETWSQQRLDGVVVHRRDHQRDAAGRLDRARVAQAERQLLARAARRAGSACGPSTPRISEVVTAISGLIPSPTCPCLLRRENC